MPRGVLIPPTGRPYSATATGLAELQALVGGDIESLPWPNGLTAYCNEDGKALGLPANPRATLRLAVAGLLLPDDVLVGPVAVFGPVDADGGETDLPDSAGDELLADAGRPAAAGAPARTGPTPTLESP